MSLEKTKLRSAAMNEVGNRLDDVLEATKSEMHRAEGGMATATKALERSLQLTTLVDKDLDDGLIDIEGAKLAKGYLARVQSAMKSLVLEEEKRRNVAQGMVMGLDRAVKETKTMLDREDAKIVVPETVPVAQRSVGGRPSGTIKEQRLAEEAEKPKPRKATKKSAKKAPAKKRATKAKAQEAPN